VQDFDEEGRLVGEATWLSGVSLHPRSTRLMQTALERIARSTVAAPPAPPTSKDGGAAGPPFAPLAWDRQAAALRRLMAYRYLAGLPSELELDHDYAVACAAGARLLEKLGFLSHTPERPEGCPDALWEWGYRGVNRSNLHQNADVVAAVDGFLDDSDPDNVAHVGHRRWALNPAMGRTAFGEQGPWVAMYALDDSGAAAGREAPPYVAYPAPGYFPVGYLAREAAWSISLDPQHYKEPAAGEVRVEVRAADERYGRGSPMRLKDLYVDGPGAGHGACVIFRSPAEVAPGRRYWVSVQGLEDTAGQPAPLDYLVEFYR
ncbi:MAG: hypothetical protein HY722_02715, partial [Planctomycetes bacterium]|nr:hypothetical protein [Planctomycetota bacterium]